MDSKSKTFDRKVEEDRSHRDLLLENERLRGDLLTIAYRISHDLRTPLGGIIGATEALKEILAETDPSALALVNSALSSADELSQLIRHVSFMLKATARPLPSQPINMGKVFFATLQRLESRILNSEAIILQPNSWPIVMGVSEWLEMVWWHLLMTALRYAGQKPKIKIDWKEQTGEIKFRIFEHGLNVLQPKGAKLFQSFHVLHEANEANLLGLSMVQRLIELQGGSSGYEPSSKDGSYFFFILPQSQ